MKKSIIILFLLLAYLSGTAETLDADTIDNWQIYNGQVLLIAGHAGLIPGATLEKAMLNDLFVQYNHCVGFEDLEVLIIIENKKNEVLFEKTFTPSRGTRMKIEKEEISGLMDFKIRYKEKKENGVDAIIGQVSVQ